MGITSDTKDKVLMTTDLSKKLKDARLKVEEVNKKRESNEEELCSGCMMEWSAGYWEGVVRGLEIALDSVIVV